MFDYKNLFLQDAPYDYWLNVPIPGTDSRHGYLCEILLRRKVVFKRSSQLMLRGHSFVWLQIQPKQ